MDTKRIKPIFKLLLIVSLVFIPILFVSSLIAKKKDKMHPEEEFVEGMSLTGVQFRIPKPCYSMGDKELIIIVRINELDLNKSTFSCGHDNQYDFYIRITKADEYHKIVGDFDPMDSQNWKTTESINYDDTDVKNIKERQISDNEQYAIGAIYWDDNQKKELFKIKSGNNSGVYTCRPPENKGNCHLYYRKSGVWVSVFWNRRVYPYSPKQMANFSYDRVLEWIR